MRKHATLSLPLVLFLCTGMFTVPASAVEVRIAIPCIYDNVGNFNEGLAWVEKGGKRGFVGKTGQEMIPCIYDEAGDFNNGLAWVSKDGKSGFIDKTGQEVLFPLRRDYNYVGDFSEGLAVVSIKNPDGSTTISLSTESGIKFNNILGEYKYGYMDKTGKEVIPCEYYAATDFSNGLAKVWTDLWRSSSRAIIDKSGKEVTAFSQCAWPLELNSLSDGFYACGDKYVNKEGKLLDVDPHLFGVTVSKVHSFSEGFGAVELKLNGTFYDEVLGLSQFDGQTRWGFVDKTGSMVWSIRLMSAGNFSNGLMPVNIDGGDGRGKWGYIDKDLNIVVPAHYNWTWDFSEGLAAVEDEDDKWGFLAVDNVSTNPDTPVAYASTQSVVVDGFPVEFQCYALKDSNGNDTNYIKLRDVASVLNGTAVQFNVGWDGAVNIETGKGYTPNGSEMKTPFYGDRTYGNAAAETRINGSPAALEAIVLKDDQGGAYTYYKLRDLGIALGFRVDWSAEKGIFIETK